jgi:hypothetical protein
MIRESPVLYLSLADLAEAVYDGRISPDDLKKAIFCFVHDAEASWEEVRASVRNMLRTRCMLVASQVDLTDKILREELARAKRKGRLVWKDTCANDPWAALNWLLAARGYKAIHTARPFNQWAVIDEVQKRQLPLRVVTVPDY